MTQHALGFDVGLSGVRAAVVRDDGSLVASARRSHQRARLEDGIAEHDPADWLEGLLATGRQALAATEGVRIDAIGVAALGPAPLLVDDDLRPLTNALLFSLDRRAVPASGPRRQTPRAYRRRRHRRVRAWRLGRRGHLSRGSCRRRCRSARSNQRIPRRHRWWPPPTRNGCLRSRRRSRRRRAGRVPPR